MPSPTANVFNPFEEMNVAAGFWVVAKDEGVKSVIGEIGGTVTPTALVCSLPSAVERCLWRHSGALEGNQSLGSSNNRVNQLLVQI